MGTPAMVITTASAAPMAGGPMLSGLTTSRAASLSLPLRYMVAGLAFAVAAFGSATAYAPASLTVSS
jgi:hypothetical protein